MLCEYRHAERWSARGVSQPGGQGSDHLSFFTRRLKVDMEHDRGLVFYSLASDLVPDQPLSGVSISRTDVFSWFVLLCCCKNSELYVHGF